MERHLCRPPIGVHVLISGPPSEQGERGVQVGGEGVEDPTLNPPALERVGARPKRDYDSQRSDVTMGVVIERVL
jgi:hypothetical protein